MIRVTTLMDNRAGQKSLRAEHGLSFLLEGEGLRLLFDCGQGANTWYNARKLGRDVANVDAVALSHSHYDHAAGFRDWAEQFGGGVLYTGRHFFEPKFERQGVAYRDLSCGFDERFLRDHAVRHEVVDGMREIGRGAWLIDDFPRVHDFETVPEKFVRQVGEALVPDDFADEICLALARQDGAYLFCGCAHPGILNMVSRVRDALGRPVRAVFGGTHLSGAGEERVRRTVAALRSMGVAVAGLSHCSGDAAEIMVNECEGMTACHLCVGDCLFLK